jgi:hypothetical protein
MDLCSRPHVYICIFVPGLSSSYNLLPIYICTRTLHIFVPGFCEYLLQAFTLSLFQESFRFFSPATAHLCYRLLCTCLCSKPRHLCSKPLGIFVQDQKAFLFQAPRHVLCPSTKIFIFINLIFISRHLIK